MLKGCIVKQVFIKSVRAKNVVFVGYVLCAPRQLFTPIKEKHLKGGLAKATDPCCLPLPRDTWCKHSSLMFLWWWPVNKTSDTLLEVDSAHSSFPRRVFRNSFLVGSPQRPGASFSAQLAHMRLMVSHPIVPSQTGTDNTPVTMTESTFAFLEGT